MYGCRGSYGYAAPENLRSKYARGTVEPSVAVPSPHAPVGGNPSRSPGTTRDANGTPPDDDGTKQSGTGIRMGGVYSDGSAQATAVSITILHKNAQAAIVTFDVIG